MSEHYLFPRVLADIIAQYAAIWRMKPWVAALYEQNKRRLRMDIHKLWRNPNGIDMCLEMNLPISWSDLGYNPSPWAIARLKQHSSNGVQCVIANTRHSDLVYLLNLDHKKIDWPTFLANPEIFEQKCDPAMILTLSE